MSTTQTYYTSQPRTYQQASQQPATRTYYSLPQVPRALAHSFETSRSRSQASGERIYDRSFDRSTLAQTARLPKASTRSRNFSATIPKPPAFQEKTPLRLKYGRQTTHSTAQANAVVPRMSSDTTRFKYGSTLRSNSSLTSTFQRTRLLFDREDMKADALNINKNRHPQSVAASGRPSKDDQLSTVDTASREASNDDSPVENDAIPTTTPQQYLVDKDFSAVTKEFTLEKEGPSKKTPELPETESTGYKRKILHQKWNSEDCYSSLSTTQAAACGAMDTMTSNKVVQDEIALHHRLQDAQKIVKKSDVHLYNEDTGVGSVIPLPKQNRRTVCPNCYVKQMNSQDAPTGKDETPTVEEVVLSRSEKKLLSNTLGKAMEKRKRKSEDRSPTSVQAKGQIITMDNTAYSNVTQVGSAPPPVPEENSRPLTAAAAAAPIAVSSSHNRKMPVAQRGPQSPSPLPFYPGGGNARVDGSTSLQALPASYSYVSTERSSAPQRLINFHTNAPAVTLATNRQQSHPFVGMTNAKESDVLTTH